MKSSVRSFLLALTIGTLAIPMGVLAQTDSRIVVKTADDLPRHTYQIEGKSLDFLKNQLAFNALVDAMVGDINADLAKYKIEDAATLRGAYDFLSTAAALRGDFDKALDYTERVRELETKEAEKLMRGVTLRAFVSATRGAGQDKARFADLFKAELRKQVEPMPFDVVKDRLIGARNMAKIATVQLVESSLTNQMDPVLEANRGNVTADVAGALVTTKFTLDLALPLLPLMAEVYGEIIDSKSGAAAMAESDLWTPRLVTLPTSAQATPVVLAVWDSGVDTSLFEGQLWANAGETANGKDDDQNGFVDDLHGIAWGFDHRPVKGPLALIDGLQGDLTQLISYIAASQDMQAGIENEAVEAFRQHYASLQGDQLRVFTDDLNLIGGYCHGTHVAGIAVAGNPFARLVHVSENWPYKSIPEMAPTIEEYRQWGQSSKQTVDYLKKAGVRVVNMSWRIPRSAVEAMLQAKGVGKDTAERAELSRKIFAEFHDGLKAAIASAPEILFIAGAGNEDNDLDFNEYIPAGLRLPNLITVSAVNHVDKPASFTSFGEGVTLYANGYRIESVIPGGQKIKFSGTSMSAPQVSNLAAKILALKPELKPAEVVELIRVHSDPLPDQPGRFIINPAKTIAAIANSK